MATYYLDLTRMYFADRNEAALQLVSGVTKHRGPHTIVLAIPRGGVPIGYVIAQSLLAPLDLIMAKKIGFPGNPEYAIGAVCENEIIVEADSEVRPAYITEQQEKIKQQSLSRYRLLTGRARPLSLKKKKVILTDDGIATGRTILVAVRAIRKQAPLALIVAVPVCSAEAKIKIEPEVDELISCYYPDPFIGVGRFYKQFSQVTDQEAALLLRKANPNAGTAVSP